MRLKRGHVTSGHDPDEMDLQFAEENSGLAWGVEIESDSVAGKSIFRSARRVILDGEAVQVQLLDGSYEAYPFGRVRKVLAMRAAVPEGYTDPGPAVDDIY